MIILKKSVSIFLCFLILLSLMNFNTFASDISIKRINCTFKGNSQTSRGFSWFTDEKTSSDIQIVKTEDFDGSFSNAKTYSGETQNKYRGEYPHKVDINDLEKGTEYTYRVGDKDKNIWSENGTFKTDGADNCFSFITIADVQASNKSDFESASQVLKKAETICPDSAFTVNLGDFVNDNTNEEWDYYFDCFSFNNMNTTLVPVAGNHDGNITNKLNINSFNSMFNLEAENSNSKMNWINGVYYSFDYSNAHFAVLNTNDMYPMLQSQRNWLINDMKNSDKDWKIVLIHRPVYSEGKNVNKPLEIMMREVLIPLFDELDIDLVLEGHDHCYYRSKQVKNDEIIKNVEYITELYNGEETDFALNPDGTVYILPSSAGEKRYSVHQAINPIGDNCAFRQSTESLGGCFLTTQIDTDKLILKAYTVDDETKQVTLLDSYAIKKEIVKGSTEASSLPTDNALNIFASIINMYKSFAVTLREYLFVLLPQKIRG